MAGDGVAPRRRFETVCAIDASATGSARNFGRKLRRVYAIDTEVWDENGRRYRLKRHWRGRRAPLALLPLVTTSRYRRSISFDRAPAIVAD